MIRSVKGKKEGASFLFGLPFNRSVWCSTPIASPILTNHPIMKELFPGDVPLLMGCSFILSTAVSYGVMKMQNVHTCFEGRLRKLFH